MSWLEVMLDRMDTAEREGVPATEVSSYVFDTMASNVREYDDEELVY